MFQSIYNKKRKQKQKQEIQEPIDVSQLEETHVGDQHITDQFAIIFPGTDDKNKTGYVEPVLYCWTKNR